jgi:hypothetical protein
VFHGIIPTLLAGIHQTKNAGFFRCKSSGDLTGLIQT